MCKAMAGIGFFIDEFKRNLKVKGTDYAPRRDEWLRPLRGIPATPPESLASGRGRRHTFSKLVLLVYLFREGSPSAGGRATSRASWCTSSLGHEEGPLLRRGGGHLRYEQGAHRRLLPRACRVREFIPPGAAAPARLLYSWQVALMGFSSV